MWLPRTCAGDFAATVKLNLWRHVVNEPDSLPAAIVLWGVQRKIDERRCPIGLAQWQARRRSAARWRRRPAAHRWRPAGATECSLPSSPGCLWPLKLFLAHCGQCCTLQPTSAHFTPFTSPLHHLPPAFTGFTRTQRVRVGPGGVLLSCICCVVSQKDLSTPFPPKHCLLAGILYNSPAKLNSK
jgi:hypothetical protein